MLNNIKSKNISFSNDPQQMKILETIIFKEEELKKIDSNITNQTNFILQKINLSTEFLKKGTGIGFRWNELNLNKRNEENRKNIIQLF